MITRSTETQQFDVFLAHNSREKPAVETLAYKLRAEGLNPWLDKEQLIPGTRWQDGLADGLRASSTCAVFIGKNDLGNWESEELDMAQNRAANDRGFRVIPVLLPSLPDPFDPSPLPPFLFSRTWVDFRPGLNDARAFNRLVCAIRGIPPGPEDSGPPVATDDRTKAEIVPYLGLRAFDEADARLFFGREADVQRLVEKLKAARFLAVIGASGSGKSSLARAGLVPALRRNALPGSDQWMIRVFRPGARPLAELALHLVRLRGEDQRPGALTEMEQELRRDERAMHNAVRLKLTSLQLKPEEEARRRALLVVDQFEEVFTLCQDDAERIRFLDNLLYASAALDGQSIVVLTMRADFYYKCAAYGGLSARIAAHQYLVGPMAKENLRQAVEEPARLAGLKIEPELLAEALAEVSNRPGTLPLLEYALLEVWKRRREGRLTLKAYRESGGVKEALAQRAEAVFTALSPNRQEIVKRVMLRLTQPGEGTDDTHRRVRMSEMFTRTDEREIVAEVINIFANERLLTTSADEQTQDQLVDVSHEALIRGWPRLRNWVEEDRAGLRTLLRLNDAAQEWRRENRDEELLYRGARLAVALEWRARNEGRLNELEREFLAASEELKTDVLSRLAGTFGFETLKKQLEQRSREFEQVQAEYNKLMSQFSRLNEQKAQLEKQFEVLQMDIQKDTPKVFLSYVREDEQVVRDLYRNLKEKGMQPWLDKEDLMTGVEWDRAIRKAIRQSDFIVICISSRTGVKRGYIQRELRLALDFYEELPPGEAFLMPVRLEECEVPEDLLKYQHTDLFCEDGFERLIKSILSHWAKRGRQ